MKFPMPNNHDLCPLQKALDTFHDDFHEVVQNLTPAEIQEVRDACNDIQTNIQLTDAQWICLLGMQLCLCNVEPDHDRPRW